MPKRAAIAEQMAMNANSVLNAMSEPVVMIDAGNRFIFANLAAENFFLASSVQLSHEQLDSFIPPTSPLLALLQQVRDQNAPVSEYRLDLSSPRLGTNKLVDVLVTPSHDDADQIVILFRSQTMAAKLDQQMMHRGAARSVTTLAAMLGHEIKNPLSGIRGAAQLLESVVDDADRPLTQLIREETDRIVSLVDRMEIFSDERPIERENVNIHGVLDRVRRIAQNGFGAQVQFQDQYDPSLPDVLGNRDQLIQVFLNLVKNAVEASSQVDNPTVTLRSAYRPGVRLSVPGAKERIALPLEFCVIDNGAGVPADLRPHMFDPFITTKTNGSGLGLALVAKIVGDHGGIIECDSQPGETTFRVLLPIAQAERPVITTHGILSDKQLIDEVTP